MDINIKIDDQGLRNTLASLVDRGGDLSPAMQAIAGALGRGIEQTFRDQAAPDGLPWTPLSKVTIARREKSGHTPISILQQTGQLAAISTGFGSNYAVAGTNVVYAATHQFGAKKGDFGTNKRGGPIPWGDIPARRFLGVSEQTRGEIIEILTRYLSQSSTTA